MQGGEREGESIQSMAMGPSLIADSSPPRCIVYFYCWRTNTHSSLLCVRFSLEFLVSPANGAWCRSFGAHFISRWHRSNGVQCHKILLCSPLNRSRYVFSFVPSPRAFPSDAAASLAMVRKIVRDVKKFQWVLKHREQPPQRQTERQSTLLYVSKLTTLNSKRHRKYRKTERHFYNNNNNM